VKPQELEEFYLSDSQANVDFQFCIDYIVLLSARSPNKLERRPALQNPPLGISRQCCVLAETCLKRAKRFSKIQLHLHLTTLSVSSSVTDADSNRCRCLGSLNCRRVFISLVIEILLGSVAHGSDD